ncbi:MAG: molybdopterin-dependent oxidoreductase, partial [Alphaproteobacteria bacterium]|nr:molybdopterin-dependent oxidoreductase [Alphaproteobacteria bacterium]
GMDPIEFRILNGVEKGDRHPTGPAYPRIGYLEMLKTLKESDHYKTPLEGPNRGRGFASGFWGNWGGRSSVSASVNADGTVNLIEGSTDIGGSRASMAMMLAEGLGIAAEDVTPTVADTDSVGYTDVTGGSRVTFATGIAAIEAAKDIRGQMVERAAQLWEVETNQVRYEDGQFIGPAQSVGFKELAQQLHATSGPIVGHGTSSEAAQSGAFGTHCVDVEVDEETGKVQILRYTVAQDVGTAIHPSY